MPDYAGAKAAIRARFEAAWTATRITYQNENPEQTHPELPWPPTENDPDAPGHKRLAPWVNLEIIGSGSEIAGTGTPGNHVWRYDGDILVHVFAPVNTSDELVTQLALQAGEIFRAAKFYDGTPGFCVRTLTPSIDDGDSGDDQGNWFRCTMTCDFTYWHRA